MALNTIKAILGIDSSGMKKGLTDAEKAAAKSKARFKAVGVIAAAAFTAAAAAAVKFAADSVKAFVDFEKGMAEVFTLLPNVSEKEFGKMNDQVMDLSKKFGILPNEAVPALYQALSAGVPKENVFQFMEVASAAAIGGITTLETAVDGITSVMNAYGKENMSAKEASDAMFTTVRLGKTTFEELASNIATVTPVAKAAGVSFDDLSAMIAALTARGTPTSEALTQIRSAILSINAPTEKAQKVAKKYNIDLAKMADDMKKPGGVLKVFMELREKTGGNIAAMKALLGRVEAVNAVMALTEEGGKDLANAIGEMATKSGASDAAMEKMANTFDFQIKKMKARWEVFKISFGKALGPLLRAVGPILDELLTTFEKLPWKEFESAIKDLGEAMGDMFKGNDGAIKAFIKMGFDAVLMLIRFTTACANIQTALAGLGITKLLLFPLKATMKILEVFMSTLGSVANIITGGSGALKGLAKALGATDEEAQAFADHVLNMTKSIRKGIQSVKDFVAGMWDWLVKDVFGGVMYWLRGIKGFITKEGTDMTSILKQILKLWVMWVVKIPALIYKAWKMGIYDPFITLFKRLWNFIKDGVTSIKDWLFGKIDETGAKVYNALPDWVKKSITKVKELFVGFYEWIKGIIAGIWDFLKSTVASIWNLLDKHFPMITGAARKVKDALGAFLGWIFDKVSWVAGVISDLVNKVIGWFSDIEEEADKAAGEIKKADKAADEARKNETRRRKEKEREEREEIERKKKIDEERKKKLEEEEETEQRKQSRLKGLGKAKELGINMEMLEKMAQALGLGKKILGVQVESPISDLLRQLGEGTINLEEALRETFGEQAANRIMAMGKENAERIKRMQEYSQKSLGQLAKMLGMSEQEMLDAYNAGRLRGPVVDIIRKKLNERNKIKRELSGVSAEEIEKEKENLELAKKIRALEEKKAKERQSELEEMRKGALARAKAAQAERERREQEEMERIKREQEEAKRRREEGTKRPEAPPGPGTEKPETKEPTERKETKSDCCDDLKKAVDENTKQAEKEADNQEKENDEEKCCPGVAENPIKVVLVDADKIVKVATQDPVNAEIVNDKAIPVKVDDSQLEQGAVKVFIVEGTAPIRVLPPDPLNVWIKGGEAPINVHLLKVADHVPVDLHNVAAPVPVNIVGVMLPLNVVGPHNIQLEAIWQSLQGIIYQNEMAYTAAWDRFQLNRRDGFGDFGDAKEPLIRLAEAAGAARDSVSRIDHKLGVIEKRLRGKLTNQ